MKLFNIISTKVKVLGIGAALTGSLFCMSPITAFAGGLECTCEARCTEDCIDSDCPLCQEDYQNCEAPESETQVEEEWGALTPDGNMSIVDDYGSLEAGGKQFITVVTKNGNYFYIIIDRDDEGDETVHFLNMVDESDLLSLMDEDQVNDYIALTGGTKEEEEVKPTTTPEIEQTGEEDTEEPVQMPEKKSKTNGIMALILIAALCGAGGYMYFITTKHSKKKPKTKDPDEGYIDEPINLPTEEEDFDVDANESYSVDSEEDSTESEDS